MMIERLLSRDLARSVSEFPVAALIGPRQVGKTTLAKEFAKSQRAGGWDLYLDLELNSDMARLTDAEMYLESQADRLVVIDEIQRKPDLLTPPSRIGGQEDTSRPLSSSAQPTFSP